MALKKLHTDTEVIDKEYKAERVLLEAKYRQKRAVMYEGRKNLITGVVEAEENEKGGKSPSLNLFFFR